MTEITLSYRTIATQRPNNSPIVGDALGGAELKQSVTQTKADICESSETVSPLDGLGKWKVSARKSEQLADDTQQG